VLGLGLFLLAERHIGDDALIPLRLFRDSVFSLTSVTAVIIGMGMFGGIAVLPQYLQIVQGASPTEAGLLTVPLVLGIMTASVISGQITSRTGRYKIFPVIGTALMVVGLLLLSRIGVDTPLWQVDVYMAVFGLGLGGCMQTLILAVQNAATAPRARYIGRRSAAARVVLDPVGHSASGTPAQVLASHPGRRGYGLTQRARAGCTHRNRGGAMSPATTDGPPTVPSGSSGGQFFLDLDRAPQVIADLEAALLRVEEMHRAAGQAIRLALAPGRMSRGSWNFGGGPVIIRRR